jgi:hypothetical protein
MSLLAVMTMFLTTVMVVFLLYFLYDLYWRHFIYLLWIWCQLHSLF